MKKNIKLSTILLYSVLAFSVIHLTFLMLSLFSVVPMPFLESINFNYVVAFVLVGICLLLYIAFMFIEKSKKLVIPEWFKDVFFVGFFIFTNIYYLFGLYSTLTGLVIFSIYLAFVLNIIALSIFFNVQKSETNILKTTQTYTVFTVFTYAIALFAMVETVVSAFKTIFAPDGIFTTLPMFIIDMCAGVLVSILFAISFAISLSKKKKLINSCLIKFYK
ncbi:MAG: hypothetical protein IJD48_04015 [Clostridia bacterium]|nr:hypothetical protein [Clostridia bacterium]